MSISVSRQDACRPWRRSRLLAAGSLLVGLIATGTIGGDVTAATDEPGSRPSFEPMLTNLALAAPADGPTGLQVVVDERGLVSQSTDAGGSTGSAYEVTPRKPEGASLRRAVLLVASTGFVGPAQGSVLLDGTPVELGGGVSSFIGSENYMTDVTDQIRSKVDAATAGPLVFNINETASSSIDGVILSLIFDDPSVLSDRSVALLFGSMQTAGDEFSLQMSEPIDPTASDSILEMSLGISFGFQSGNTGQFSTVDVNGARLTSSAGGQDDGESNNGALITVGGEGDDPANPADPLFTPTDPRYDDERYDLTPFVSGGDTVVTVTTANPSSDDNIFFASFTTNPPVDTIITPNPTVEIDLVALGDSYSSGEGTFFYDEHKGAQKCHRGPDGWPRLLEQGVAEVPRIEHKACSGAKVPNLLDEWKSNLAQIDPSTPNEDIELVTLTVGGNDAGFGGIMSECYRPLSSCADVPESKNFQNKLTKLTSRLVLEVYPAIREAYPNARIAHVGYPLIVPRPGNVPVNCGWLGEDEQVAAVEIVGDLNFAIQTAAFLTTDVEFISITDVLAGRELCTSDPWMVRVIGPTWTNGSEQGHPTRQGQNAMAQSVAFQLGFRGYVSQS